MVTAHLLTEDDALEREGVDKMLFFVAIFAIVHDVLWTFASFSACLWHFPAISRTVLGLSLARIKKNPELVLEMFLTKTIPPQPPRWCSRQPSRCSRRRHRTWGWWRGCCGCGSGHRAGETWSIWKLFWSSMCSLSHHHYHAHHWSDPPWCIPRLLHHRPSWRWLISGQPDLITIIVIIMAPIKTFVFWWLNIQKW